MNIEKRGFPVTFTWEQIEDTKLHKGHIEATPVSQEFRAARARFKAQWEAFTELGLRAGFLEREPCRECGGELTVTTNTEDRKWVPDDK